MQSQTFPRVVPSVALAIALMFAIAALPGCDRAEQTTDSAENPAHINPPAGDQQALGQVQEFDGFTLRANLSHTEHLPDSMARQYGIEAGPNLFLLNLVVMENRPDRQRVPVSAKVSAHYESLVGHVETIDMRKVEADGLVSFIGALDGSAQRVFRFVIEAQPAGADEPLQMNFEVQLPTLDSE